MITYEQKEPTKIKVLLYKKYIGDILKDEKGWRYKIARKNIFGQYFPTIGKVKESLEEE